MNYVIPVELTEEIIRQCNYSVFADLDNDGVCEEDITKDVESVNYIDVNLEMKNTGMVLGKPSVNISSISLLNEDGKYSFSKASSPYFGKFKRNTKIYIEGGFIDSDGAKHKIGLFTGVITGLRDSRQAGNNVMVVTLKDYAKFAQKKKNPDKVYFNKTISYVLDDLITYVYGVDFPREIDQMQVVFPLIELEENGYVWNSIQKFCEACDGRAYFEHDKFKFITPQSPDYNFQEAPVYTFMGKNIFDYIQSVEEDAIINKWTITSEAKVLQPRQVVVGTPSTNSLTDAVEYAYNDGKNALGTDKKTITLKFQEEMVWVDTINVPLVEDFTYVDFPDTPTQEDIDLMNQNSIHKVFDKDTGNQLTIYSIDYKTGKIVLKDPIANPEYRIQVTYQYYTDRIVTGKYKWYNFELDKITANLFDPSKSLVRGLICWGSFFDFHSIHTDTIVGEGEIPSCPICGRRMKILTKTQDLQNLVLEAHDGYDLVNVTLKEEEQGILLTDWQVSGNNKNIKFRLMNNIPARYEGEEPNRQLIDTLYISKMEIYGNPLECVFPLKVISADAPEEFENAYDINNDYIIDEEYAQKVCDEYRWRYGVDRPYLEVRTKGIPQIEMLDRVRVTDVVSGIDYDFIVIGYKHTIKKDGWETSLTLESLIEAWEFDPSSVKVEKFQYKVQGAVDLKTVNVLSHHDFEDIFEGDRITHSVIVEFESILNRNISNFLEGKILIKEQAAGSRYIHKGSFTDIATKMFKIEGLESDKEYKVYVVVSNKFGSTSFYGEGYALNTPTTGELKASYAVLPPPANFSVVKGTNETVEGKVLVTAGCNPCPYQHYKSTIFEMVGKDKLWTDASKISREITTNSTVFELPTEGQYKFRVAYKDIWNRVGSYTEFTSPVSGSVLKETVADILEIEVTSSINPTSGTLESLYEGSEEAVTFGGAVSISYKYPYAHTFNLVRLKTVGAVSFYVQYLKEDNTWGDLVGSASVPKTAIANEFLVFPFVENGKEVRRSTRELKIIFTGACSIAFLAFDTFGYYDNLIVRDGQIKSAKIDNLQADKIRIGDSSAPIPLAVQPGDTLFRFDGSLLSTQGEKPLGME